MVGGTPAATLFGRSAQHGCDDGFGQWQLHASCPTAQLGTGAIEADEGPATLTNGSVSGTYTSNTAGTIVSGNPSGGTFTVSNGLVSGKQQGAPERRR